ncbi:MAG TPA: PAS domain S-box protein, partial [Coriobacteriia bacterium]
MTAPNDPESTADRTGAAQPRDLLELLDALPVAVSVSRFGDGFITYANLALVALLHADGPHEVVGHPVAAFVDPRDAERVAEDIRSIRRGGSRTGDHRFRFLRCDGSGGVLEAYPIPFEQRGEPALLSIMLDITDREEARQDRDALERS